MPATTTRVSSEVKQMLAAGQISRFEEGTGVARTLHANCPDDGGRASVRRMSRELGGAVMEVTMRCPVCFNDFVAAPESLYLSGRASKSSATKAPAPAAKQAAAKPAAKAPVKTAGKAAGKAATKSTAKTAPKAPARTAAKKAVKASAKAPAKSSKTSTAKRPAAAKKSAAKKGSGRSGR